MENREFGGARPPEPKSVKFSQKKSKGVGYALLVAAILFFCWYWYYLLEPAQANILSGGHPFVSHLAGAVLFAIWGGCVFALLTYLAGTFIGFWWQKWAEFIDFKWHDVFSVSSYWIWTLVAVVGFVLFTCFWFNDL
jgi:hypothetical protein